MVREWNGALHEVEVLENGYLWRGTRHRSLSAIARDDLFLERRLLEPGITPAAPTATGEHRSQGREDVADRKADRGAVGRAGQTCLSMSSVSSLRLRGPSLSICSYKSLKSKGRKTRFLLSR